MAKILKLSHSSSIKRALKILNENSNFGAILNIVSNKKELLGVLTEGDLRRSILSGKSLSTRLEFVMNKNYFYISSDDLKKNKFLHSKINSDTFKNAVYLPVINNKKILKNVIHINSVKRLFGLPKKIKKITKTTRSSILIIGGGGYIGSVLTSKLLKFNHKVKVLDKFFYDQNSLIKFKKNKNLKIIKDDVSKISVQVEAIKDVDSVIFLAELVGDPLCRERPEEALRTNYLSLSSMANLCSYMKIKRFVYTSSCSVYGSTSGTTLLDEKSSLNPVSHYARMKVLSEQSLLSASSENFNPTILRLATVFGHSPRQRFDLVVNTFVKNAFFKKKLSVDGNGLQLRPNIHVKDVADAIIKIINSPTNLVKGQIFNISNSKENLSIADLAKKVQKNFKKCSISFNKKKTDQRNYKVSSKKIEKKLNYKAKISVSEGIKEMKKFLQKNSKKNFNLKKYSNIENFLK
jgi:nucleoside-diphosphate-sugar epimerase/CBS domain-containing protein